MVVAHLCVGHCIIFDQYLAIERILLYDQNDRVFGHLQFNLARHGSGDPRQRGEYICYKQITINPSAKTRGRNLRLSVTSASSVCYFSFRVFYHSSFYFFTGSADCSRSALNGIRPFRPFNKSLSIACPMKLDFHFIGVNFQFSIN